MRTLKKLSIYSISLFFAFFAETAVNIACGPEPDPYDYFVSFFHNNVAGGKELSNFYFTEFRYLFEESEPVAEADVNIAEWLKETGKDVKREDLKKLMYGLDRSTDSLVSVQLQRGREGVTDSLSTNSFLNFLLSPKKKNFRQYYILSKQIEFANPSYEPWNPVQADTTQLYSLLQEALLKAGKEKNRFLKNRYYYQAAKLSHYTGDYKQVIKIFDKELAKQSRGSHLQGWALSLKAGALRRLDDTVRSAYYFSRVFAEYPERRVQAYRNYRNIAVAPELVERLCSGKKEAAVLWAIEGFGDPELNLSYLRHTYELDPGSELNGVLLAREVNKLESVYLSEKLEDEKFVHEYQFNNWYSDTVNSGRQQQERHLDELKKFSIQLAGEKKYPQSDLGYITAAYLCWMKQNNEEGWNYLEKAGPISPGSGTYEQEKIVRLLLSAQKIKSFNRINETQLLPLLRWLEEKTAKSAAGDTAIQDDYGDYQIRRFETTSRNFYQLVLAPAYLQKRDTLSAALCMIKGDPANPDYRPASYQSWQTQQFFEQYLRPKVLLSLQALKAKAPENEYYRFLCDRLSGFDSNVLNELTGTAFLREHQFEKAVYYLKGLSDKKQTSLILGDWNETVLDGNPFVDRLTDYPLSRDSLNGYNKLRFAREMLSLEKKVKSDPKNASLYYYRMANGYYNASTYGNSWYLLSYSWQADDWGKAPEYYYDDDYTQVKTAKAFYLKARSMSGNPEFKARCTFMLAKCYQKQMRYPQYDWRNDSKENYEDFQKREKQYFSDNFTNPYFSELRRNYSKTRLFTMASTECSYFREFLKGE